MDIIKQCNDIMLKSIDSEPDIRIMALESELHEAKRMALDLGIMCEEINRRSAAQADLIQKQQQTIAELRRKCADGLF